MEIRASVVAPKSSGKSMEWFCLVGLYIAALAPRLLAILIPPTAFYYNLDERDVVFSSLDRLFGIPPVSIMEPATTVQAASLPLYMGDMLLSLGIPHSPAQLLEKITVYLSLATRDPRHVITIGRVLVALLCSLAPLFAYRVARYLGASFAVALACGVLVMVHPLFFLQSVMAAGDSAATTFALLSLALLLNSLSLRNTTVWYAGIVFGIAVGCKIIAAAGIVLPLSLILWYPKLALHQRLRLIAVFSLSAGVAFLAVVPYAWTDPLRFAKAVFGTVNKTGGAFRVDALWHLVVDAHGLVLVCATLIATVAAMPFIAARWQDADRYAAAAIITLGLITVLIAMHSTTAYPRYFVSTLPAIVVLFAAIDRRIAPRQPANRILMLAFIVVTLATASQALSSQLKLRGDDDLVTALRMRSALGQTRKIVIPASAFKLQMIDMPRSFWLRVAQRAGDMQEGPGLKSFVGAHGISPPIGDVLITAFNEDEQSNRRHAVAAAFTAPDLPYDVVVYAEQGEMTARQPSIDTSVEQAVSDFQSRQTTTAILVRLADPSLGTPLWRGKSEWFWYVSDTL